MYNYPFPIVRVFDVYLKSYQDGNLTCAEYFDNWYNKDLFVQKYFRLTLSANNDIKSQESEVQCKL